MINYAKKIAKIILKQINKIIRNRKIIRKINGLVFELDLREAIDYEIYAHKIFEPDTTNAIKKFSKPGMNAIDIGANIGYYTLILAQAIEENGKVIAFEPMHWAFKKLEKNISLNKFNNIILENKALSDNNENNINAKFACSWPVFENKKNLHPIHKGKAMENKTDMITLDSYANNKKIKIDLIKLDVDGYEVKVLKGAKRILKEDRPIIISELGKYTLKEVGDTPELMIDILLENNYKIINEKYLTPYKNKEDLLKSIPEYKTINIIASPK